MKTQIRHIKSWLVGAVWGGLVFPVSLMAALTDGPLRIEVVSAYNLVVDSNIESPAGRCPTAAHLGLRVYNTGTTPLTGVTLRIGDLQNAATFSGTPGVYPVTTIAPGVRGYSGSFSFTHQGGVSDATRYIPSIPAGGSAVVYWLVSYPVKDAAGKTVAGAANVVADDLRLDYDMWVEGYENGSTLRRAYAERHMTCRNEISAMANKIWPNTTSKVPDKYLDVFAEQLGWRPSVAQPRVPGADITEGIWYDFGTIRHGFDNNGDLIPDYNAWMQPVGDPSVYDASCFRLVKAYGVVIVKLNDGTEKIIPFEDELYFEHLPENNVGAVGLVFYEFIALKQGFTGRLSPYQEVASGYDNEKFNADYGATIGSWQSHEIHVTFDKNAPAVTNAGATVTYDLTARNTGVIDVGQPSLSLPVVITDTIPTGVVYVASSATAANTLPPGVGVSVRYSTNGTVWVTSEPVPASSVVALQWWLDRPLATNAAVTVRFQAAIPSGYAGVSVKNCGGVSLGNNAPISQDCATTLIQGNNSVSGTVFEDDGTGASFANGVKDAGDAGEIGLSAVWVKLYLDLNANGAVDSGDLLVATQDSAASTGAYGFTNVPDGRYVVAVDPLDPNVTENYALTTPSVRAADLDSAHATTSPVTVTDRDFGFAPPLSLNKTGGAAVYEGQDISYTLTLKNHLYSSGAVSAAKLYWMPSNLVSSASAGLTDLMSVATNTSVYTPGWGIFVDRSRNRIYWADKLANTIRQDDLDPATPASPSTLISGLTDPGYLAVDHQAPGGKQYLWWSASGKLRRADLGTIPPVPEDRYTLFSDTSCGVAIDEKNRWIYFVSKPTAKGKYTFYRQNLDSAANTVDASWSVEIGVSEPYDIELGPLGQKLYFVSRSSGVKFATLDIAAKSISYTFNVGNGLDVRGLAVDTVNDRVYFSDASANLINCNVLSTGALAASLPSGVNPGDIDIEYGAGTGTFDVNTTIGALQLTDTFPADTLSFVRATVPPDLTAPSGTLTWSNLGPLNGGDSLAIGVTFKALAQTGTGIVGVTNNAAVTAAVLVNGDTVNKPSASAPAQLLPSGSITGRVWADTDADGWQPAQTAPGMTFPSYGYEAGERGIGGVRVRLEADSNNDGTVDWAVTNRTDASGNYLFSSLATNVRYRVVIDTASLPGTGITPTGDPDDDGVNAGNGATGSADNLWDNAGAGWFSIGIHSWKNADGVAQSWDITNVNFGYTGTDPVIFGLVWLDLDRDGVRDVGEPGLSGASVALTGASAVTLVTGADGVYTFRTNSAGAELNTGSYTVTVTPPSGPTWSYTYESPTNAFGVSNGNGELNGIGTFSVTNATETSGPWNFGLIFAGSRKIGDTVYFDMDANGVQGTHEVGIAGVDVKLYLDTNGSGVLDAADFLWSAQTTDSNGTYLFTNLASAVYFVVVDESDIPTGFRQTADPDQPGVVEAAGDGMGTVTLGASDILTVDFGYAPQGGGRLGDTVFADANGNGSKDAGEGGLSNVTVRLTYDRDGDGSYETLLASTQTDSGGAYLFEHLLDGAYCAVVDAADTDLPGHLTPSTAVAHTVALSGNVTVVFDGFTTPTDRSLDADFGFVPRPYIGDFVFYDANRNGTPDIGEGGIPNVTLRLYTDPNGDGDTSDGLLLATTSTATGSGLLPAGYYQFSNLVTGGYYVVKVDADSLPMWNGSPLPQTADPDRDGVPCWDDSVPGLPPGDNADTGIVLGFTPYIGADFGYQPAGVIGDTVWRDLNGNGLLDVGEAGVAGVQVNAVMGTNTVSAYTDGDGFYSFATLADGTWTVTVAATNFASGGPLDSWTDTYDADGGLNHSTSVVIHNGAVSSADNAWTTKSDASLDVDFGFKLNGPYALTGTVCTDDSGVSGICDDPANETELAGLAVYLYTGGGLLLGSTSTDADGHYGFTNLPAGNYRVVLGTTVPPLDTSRLTTTASDTGATLLTNTGTSVIQDVMIASADREGIDFAFVPTVFFDYGDLPAVYGVTTLSQDGARHAIPTNGVTVWLGTDQPDADKDGAPSELANGDDTLDGNDDEDGVVPIGMASWTEGTDGGSVQVTVRAPAGKAVYLVGWIDFNQDGSLTGAGEQIVSTEVTGTGSAQAVTYTFDIPAGTMATTNKAWYARFRVFAEPPPYPLFSFTGTADDGEVEDTLFRASDLALGDTVWNDANGNGLQDSGENGLSGVIVYIDSNANGTRDEGELFDTTSGDGLYVISGASLQAGTHLVRVDRSTLSGDYVPSYDLDGIGSADAASVALAAGQDRLDVDFGYRIPSRLGDTVWLDANGNGQQDVGEVGLSNVVVRLYDTNSIVLATVTSTVSGAYAFTNLAEGAYSIEFTPPAGYLFTTSNVGSDASDSDPLAGTNRTATVTLASGQSDLTIDAGFYPGATLSGFVRVDVNGNGAAEAGDTNGIAGVTVQLLDASLNVVGSAITAVDGSYRFAELYPGNYTVRETDLAGWYSTTDDSAPNDNLIPVTLAIGQTSTGNIFYDTQRACIGDFVWLDVNGNGQQDFGEAGLSNVVIRLYDANSMVLATVTSAVSGAYAFTNLAAGVYTVGFTPLAGYRFTTSNVGSDATDSDPLEGTNRTAEITLASGQTDNTVDAGLYQAVSIAGTVFLDVNGNGLAETLDTNGISGVTVRLTDLTSNVVATAVTTASGTYGFTNLAPGAYIVEQTLPTGYTNTLDVAAPNDLRIPVTLASGESSVGNDFYDAVAGTGSIRGTVWNDSNGNGVIDGESGFDAVVVYLDVNDNGVLDAGEPQTLTDAAGAYAFNGLPAGPYHVNTVKTTLPAGFTNPTYDLDGTETPDTAIVVLVAGGEKTDVDFGYNNYGSISGLVWNDTNTNGVRNVGESVRTTVTVHLYDAFGSLLASRVTDANGMYLFDNLSPDNYRVELVPPSGGGLSPMDQGGDDALDSDINPYTKLTDYISVAPSCDVVNIDAGLIFGLTGLIGDFVWADLDGNGVQALNEPGISGVLVDLYTAEGTVFQIRSEIGSFADNFDAPGGGSSGFDGSDGTLAWDSAWTSVYGADVVLYGGSYQAVIDGGVGSDLKRVCTTPDGTEQITFSFDYTTPGDDTYVSEYSADGGGSWDMLGTYASPVTSAHVSYSVPVNGGTTVTLRFRKTAKTGATDSFYVDNINILNESGLAAVNTTTDANGFYFFGSSAGLVDGTAYQVRIATNQAALAGVALTGANQGSDDVNDSDAVLTNGVATIPFTWSADVPNLTLDVGFIGTAALKGLVWFDPNANGLLEEGETNASAVTVDLWYDANANGLVDAGDQIVATQTTSGANMTNFAFDGLTAGQYLVTVTDVHAILNGYSLTTANEPAAVVLAVGQSQEDVRFGYYWTNAALYGSVLLDANGNGVVEPDDTNGLAGVTVRLLDADSAVVAVTATAETGAYGFGNIAPGTYTVVQALPTGYTNTLDVAAPNDLRIPVTLASGQVSATNDFYDARCGVIGDRVFADFNNNGVWDAGEGVPGVLVTVTGDRDGDGNAESLHMTTGADGAYTFGNLYVSESGVPYTVTVDAGNLPAGLTINTADPDGGGDSVSTVSLTLAAPVRKDQDFGYRSPAVYTISGHVRDDYDLNGVFSDHDLPVSGVLVTLYTDPNGDGNPEDGVALQSMFTVNGGRYVFSNLVASAYVLVENDPGISVSVADTATANDNCIPVVIFDADSADNNFLDAIDPSGYFYDTEDGRIVSGGFISVDGPGVSILMNGSDGLYMFISTNAVPASYTMTVTLPPGYMLDPDRLPAGASFDPTGGPDPTVMGSYQSESNPGYLINYSAVSNSYYFTFELEQGDPYVINNNIPLIKTVTVGDRVWEDVNGNGAQDAGEPGLTNVTVRLLDAVSNTVMTAVTDSTGAYLFADLPPATYQIEFVPPGEYVFTVRDSVLTNDFADSDADRVTGLTSPVSYAPGTTNLTLDAGLYVPAAVYGHLFVDRNGDLLRDDGDVSVTNALVRLFVGGEVVASTTTDEIGYYSFDLVPAGTVSIMVSRASATLADVPTMEPAASDVTRNRALPDEAGIDAYIAYDVVSGYGVLSALPGEPLNFGFSTYPLSTAIDVWLYASGADGVTIELGTVDESGYGDIVVYAWIGNAWVEVGRVPGEEVIGEGSNRYKMSAEGLSSDGAYYLRVVDEAGHVHDSPVPVGVESIRMDALRLEMHTAILTFSTVYGRRYVVKVSDDLALPPGAWATEYVSQLKGDVWSAYSNRPFMAGSGTQTVVRVPLNRRKAFFKILMIED